MLKRAHWWQGASEICEGTGSTLTRRPSVAAAIAVAGAIVSAQPARPFRPVTAAPLKCPSPDDWLAWRGTTQSQGYSSLTQINRSDVSQLRVVWGSTMEPGIQQTPLVLRNVRVPVSL